MNVGPLWSSLSLCFSPPRLIHDQLNNVISCISKWQRTKLISRQWQGAKEKNTGLWRQQQWQQPCTTIFWLRERTLLSDKSQCVRIQAGVNALIWRLKDSCETKSPCFDVPHSCYTLTRFFSRHTGLKCPRLIQVNRLIFSSLCSTCGCEHNEHTEKTQTDPISQTTFESGHMEYWVWMHVQPHKES